MRTPTMRRGLLLVLAMIGSTLALVGGVAEAQPVETGPTITGEPCAPGEGVTIVVDFQNDDDADEVRIGCAEGEQADGFDALLNAGFTINEDGTPVGGTICQIDGVPTDGYPTCWYDGFWSYWTTNGESPWGFSSVGAGDGPLPVDSIKGWSWAFPLSTPAGPPRLDVEDLFPTEPPIEVQCDAVPQLPAISILHRDEVLPVTIADDSDVAVAVIAPGDDPADATFTVASSLSLADEDGPTRVLAVRADDECPDPPMFDFTYDVRDAYAPRWDATSAGAPSPAVDKGDDAIVAWATGHENYTPGANVTATFQTPDNALGPVTTSLVVLGDRGEITLTFDEPITNGPGDDFAVFENGFTVNGPNELDFLEFGYIEVSSNGSDFVRFDSGSRQETPVGAFAGQKANLVGGLAGKDLNDKGTPFDLTALTNKPEVRSGLVDLEQITHVKIVDVTGDGDDLDSFGRPIHDPHPTTGSAGFDLKGVGVLNAADGAPTEPDCELDGSGGTDAALDWLACQLDLNDGMMPASYGPGVDHGLTLDAVLAFAIFDRGDDAAAVTALDAVYSDIRDYVTDAGFGDGDDRYAGALAKSFLAGVLMDADTTDVDGLELETEVRERMQTTGDDAGRFSDESGWGDHSNGFGQTLSILALSHTDDGVPAEAYEFLLDQQCPDDGFRGDYSVPGGCDDPDGSDTDYTALAVAALATAPQTSRVRDAIEGGADWLLEHQNADGAIEGVGLTAGANTNASGVAGQSLRAVGHEDAADAAAGWIATLQLVDSLGGQADNTANLGAIAYSQGGFDAALDEGITSQMSDQWRRATAQAVLAEADGFGVAGPTVTEPAEAWVLAAHEDLLDRSATAAEIAAIVDRFDAGTTKRAVAKELANTEEWVSTMVTRFYQDTLGRAPDAAGLAHWTGQIVNGKLTVAQVATRFYSSAEYFNREGGTDEAWVTALYDALVHRSPDQAGLAYWVGRTASKGRADVAAAFYKTLESRKDRVEVQYQALLGRSADAAGRTHWAGRIATEGDLALTVHLIVSGEYQTKAEIRFP